MSEKWPEVTIGEICNIQADRREPQHLPADTRYLGLEHIESEHFRILGFGPIEEISSSVSPFQKTDVLFGRLRPYLRKVVLADTDGVCTPEILVLRPNPSLVLPLFLHSVVSSEPVIERCIAMSAGTRMPRTKANDLAEIPVLLPPLDVQNRVVDLIESMDSYIDALRTQADAARTARTSLLHELLYTDGDDWTDAVLSDLLRRSIGGVWGSEKGSEEVDVTVVRSTEFTSSGYLNFATGVRRSCTARQLASRELQEGDILLEKSGGGPNQPVGRVVYVTDEIPNDTVCTNFVQLVSPDPEAVCPGFVFLLMWLWHSEGRTLGYQAQTTGIRNLRTKDYLAQTIRLPPRAAQQHIVDIASAVEDLVTATKEAIAVATRLRTGLLSELLSGGHEIPESYDALLEAS